MVTVGLETTIKEELAGSLNDLQTFFPFMSEVLPWNFHSCASGDKHYDQPRLMHLVYRVIVIA